MAKNLTNEQKLKLIKELKQRVKHNKVMIELFDKYDLPIDEFDLIPMVFADLPVSARTDHGIIYLNNKLLENLKNNDHYIAHEVVHWAQQTTGSKPTKGAIDGDYLENEYEQEGFQNQTEYISDTKGDNKAKEYIEKVLDHHEVENPKDRKEKRKDLLNLALNSIQNLNIINKYY